MASSNEHSTGDFSEITSKQSRDTSSEKLPVGPTIDINYSGSLAFDLSWNLSEIEDLVNELQIRSNIHIVSFASKQNLLYPELATSLSWVNTGLDFFQQTQPDQPSFIRVKTLGDMEIVIDDFYMRMSLDQYGYDSYKLAFSDYLNKRINQEVRNIALFERGYRLQMLLYLMGDVSIRLVIPSVVMLAATVFMANEVLELTERLKAYSQGLGWGEVRFHDVVETGLFAAAPSLVKNLLSDLSNNFPKIKSGVKEAQEISNNLFSAQDMNLLAGLRNFEEYVTLRLYRIRPLVQLKK